MKSKVPSEGRFIRRILPGLLVRIGIALLILTFCGGGSAILWLDADTLAMYGSPSRSIVARNTAELEQLRAELALARMRWEANAIVDYDINVERHNPMRCAFRVTLHVRDSELVGITDLTAESGEVGRSLDDYCDFRRYLVPAMFEFVEDDLNNVGPAEGRILLEFDAQYGYVTMFEIVEYRAATADAHVRFAIGNLQVIRE